MGILFCFTSGSAEEAEEAEEAGNNGGKRGEKKEAEERQMVQSEGLPTAPPLWASPAHCCGWVRAAWRRVAKVGVKTRLSLES